MILADLPTPHLVLDRVKLQKNLNRMSTRADELGVRLRPHMKTAKSIEVAKLALVDRPACITVSTMKEARYFAEHGLRDIVLAVGLVPQRLEEVVALLVEGVSLAVTTDMPEVAELISAAGRRAGVTIPVMIEVDEGETPGESCRQKRPPAPLVVRARVRRSDGPAEAFAVRGGRSGSTHPGRQTQPSSFEMRCSPPFSNIC